VALQDLKAIQGLQGLTVFRACLELQVLQGQLVERVPQGLKVIKDLQGMLVPLVFRGDQVLKGLKDNKGLLVLLDLMVPLVIKGQQEALVRKVPRVA